MYIEVESQEIDKVRNLEPTKCWGWEWVSLELLRDNLTRLFCPLRDFLNKFSHVEKASDFGKMIKQNQVANIV